MMELYDIFIAFVSWGSEGKRRPILILDVIDENVKAFSITTQYESKSEEIRVRYFVITDWKQSGLDRPSYVNTNNTVTIPLTAVDSNNPIGKLTASDERRLVEFIAI